MEKGKRGGREEQRGRERLTPAVLAADRVLLPVSNKTVYLSPKKQASLFNFIQN